MRKLFQYLVLVVAGPAIILCCSLFQSVPSVQGEYHYSEFLRGNYQTVAGMLSFVIAGICVGYFWSLNPWISGACFVLVFPVTSLIEATVYRGSHNLLPFEFIFFSFFALPTILGVYLGKYFFKQSVARRKIE